MKYKRDKGFTLVEVVVAVAMVAIVSTALFQMFVTTSHVNRDAQLMDLANVVAVQQAENFKAHPESYNAATIYYNSQGALLTAPESGGIPTGAVIKVDSAVTMNSSINDPGSTGYFPSFVGTIDLSPYTATDPATHEDIGCDIEIKPTNEIYYGLHGSDLASLQSQVSTNVKNNIMPIRVNFTSGSQPSRTINLINNSTVEVAIYFVTQDSDNPAQSVTLNPVSGYSSITKVVLTSSTNTEYKLLLTVSKLIGNVSQSMFTYSTNKYLYN